MKLHEAKQQMRREIYDLKKLYSEAEQESLSARIMERVEKTDMFRESSCVALYHAIPGEVQTAGFIQKWYRQKTLLLPLVKGDELLFLRYTGKECLKMGSFGILEPKEPGERVDEEEIDLILVPGVAFDRCKNRLGRGKGYYDRLLASLDAPRIGLCYGFQLREKIPAEPFDIKMDSVITEEEEF